MSCKFSPVLRDRDQLVVHPCDSVATKTIQAPGYALKVNNLPDPNGESAGSCVLRDDDHVLIEDDDNSTICMDQI
jgi:hypothetical protein